MVRSVRRRPPSRASASHGMRAGRTLLATFLVLLSLSATATGPPRRAEMAEPRTLRAVARPAAAMGSPRNLRPLRLPHVRVGSQPAAGWDDP
jgi:hypothetical protein